MLWLVNKEEIVRKTLIPACIKNDIRLHKSVLRVCADFFYRKVLSYKKSSARVRTRAFGKMSLLRPRSAREFPLARNSLFFMGFIKRIGKSTLKL